MAEEALFDCPWQFRSVHTIYREVDRATETRRTLRTDHPQQMGDARLCQTVPRTSSWPNDDRACHRPFGRPSICRGERLPARARVLQAASRREPCHTIQVV